MEVAVAGDWTLGFWFHHVCTFLVGVRRGRTLRFVSLLLKLSRSTRRRGARGYTSIGDHIDWIFVSNLISHGLHAI
jgi:hypothetical protein